MREKINIIKAKKKKKNIFNTFTQNTTLMAHNRKICDWIRIVCEMYAYNRCSIVYIKFHTVHVFLFLSSRLTSSFLPSQNQRKKNTLIEVGNVMRRLSIKLYCIDMYVSYMQFVYIYMYIYIMHYLCTPQLSRN